MKWSCSEPWFQGFSLAKMQFWPLNYVSNTNLVLTIDCFNLVLQVNQLNLTSITSYHHYVKDNCWCNKIFLCACLLTWHIRPHGLTKSKYVEMLINYLKNIKIDRKHYGTYCACHSSPYVLLLWYLHMI